MNAEITVYGYGGMGPLPDLSPFVHKLENHLRLAGLAYDKQLGDFRKAPRGKLPYIEHAGEAIPDSQGAIDHLARQGIAELDDWLGAGQRAEAVALRSMVELDLYFVLLFFRWQQDMGWEGGYRERVSQLVRAMGVPGFLAGAVAKNARKSVIRQLWQQGTGRREPDEVEAHGRKIFAALDEFAGRHEGPFWFGERPSSLDAVIHAFVAGFVAEGVPPTPLARVGEDCPRLMARFEHLSRATRASDPGAAGTTT